MYTKKLDHGALCPDLIQIKIKKGRNIAWVFLLRFGLLAIPASVCSQDAKVSLRMENQPVDEVFSAIKAQTGYSFWFNVKDVDTGRKVSLRADNETVRSVLAQALSGQDVDFTIYENHIIISKKGTLTATQTQQANFVTGTVTDKGQPLPGVNVMVKGTTTGVVTDPGGKYRIANPGQDAILMFSFLGYEPQEVMVGNRQVIDVALEETVRELEDIVVIGYGTVKKSDLTGAVSSLSRKDLGDRVTTDIGSLLSGKVSGVDVSQGAIRVRGVTTLNNTDPLVIVDDFMGGSYNPNDIENIEVLKDASSTAIYGARGANGVILITTKSGEAGPMKMDVNIFTGFDFWPKKWNLLNASQYVDFATDALTNAGRTIAPNLLDSKYRTDVTDWQNVMRETGHKTEANFSFSGGSEKAVYSLFLGYRYTDGIIKGSSTNNNVHVRSKNEFRIAKWLKAGVNLSFNYSTYRSGWVKADAMYGALPYLSIYDPENTKGLGYSDSNTQNDGVGQDTPLIFAEEYEYNGVSLSFQPNVWTEIEIIKGLVYRMQAGVSGSFGRKSEWNPDFIMGGGTQNFTSRLMKSHSYAYSPMVENYITYSKVIGKHDFSVMAGNSWQNYGENGNLEAIGSPFSDYTVKKILVADKSQVIQQNFSKWAYLSYFGRINYQFNNRYLVTANLRADGSPKFAPSNRWGYFPSVAVAWKMHEESWIKNLGVFDQLKIRAGWGESGNDSISDFMYLAKVWSINVFYPFGDDGDKHTGATVMQNAASNIKWETTISRTIGLDVAFLGNRLTGTVEYFSKSTNDILFGVPRAPSLGYGQNNNTGDPIVNAASVRNTGFELMVGYQDRIGKLNYSVSANYTYVYNKVTSLGAGQPYMYNMGYVPGVNYAVARTDVGYPIGYFYGFIADGIFMTQAELDAANAAAQAKGHAYYQDASTKPGDVRYKDLNGDGYVNWENDRTKTGSPIPNHYFGLNLGLEYKGFDLNMDLQGIAGSYLFNGNYGPRSGTSLGNKDAYVLNRWRSEQEPGNGRQPRAVVGDPAQNNRPSTLLMEKADYLKIRQLSIGYTLPKRWVNKIGLDNLRVYCSTYNLYTFTGYSQGYDPDISGSNNYNLARGFEKLSEIPNPRTIIFGLQFGL